MANTIDQKLAALEKEMEYYQLNKLIFQLNELKKEFDEQGQQLIDQTIILINNKKMNKRELEKKADELHEANVKAVEDLKQIADSKTRTKRPRVEHEKINNLIIRKSK